MYDKNYTPAPHRPRVKTVVYFNAPQQKPMASQQNPGNGTKDDTSQEESKRLKSPDTFTPPSEAEIDRLMDPRQPWNRSFMTGEICKSDPEKDAKIRDMIRSGIITFS